MEFYQSSIKKDLINKKMAQLCGNNRKCKEDQTMLFQQKTLQQGALLNTKNFKNSQQQYQTAN